ncbi:MAG: putative ADP-producing CoA ligase, feruloyl-CoA synthetase, partial [Frankiales bacterium]|nr:putative ADP-producing CoA ligase, feruloyl-CoA synthetase [Frankiales bacterium]
PMFHIAGLNLLTTPALLMGATITVHTDFDPGAVLREVGERSVTVMLCPPPLTGELVAHPSWEQTCLDSLRCVMTGGTTVTQASVQAWHDRGVPVVQGYGMTEAGTNVTLVPLAESWSRSMTAGKPALGSRIRVLAATGDEVAPGGEGEIAVQSSSMMREYWDNPEATRAAVPDGWLRTGDVGWVDAEGYLHVVDRLKEVIIVGTSNVYPADLEAVLAESPDIDAAAVVGRVDATLGEAPVAFVVPAPGRTLTKEEVLALFDDRLAPYKKPRDVIFLEALPRTSVGKPHKAALRALAAEGAAS